mmetsp:Transcript_34648/g.95584  ORF Transcript_34648/g.95584 Transcript_34648/m.95584 type:complete len:224 (+) Transcript_34648:1549-2220(+)
MQAGSGRRPRSNPSWSGRHSSRSSERWTRSSTPRRSSSDRLKRWLWRHAPLSRRATAGRLQMSRWVRRHPGLRSPNLRRRQTSVAKRRWMRARLRSRNSAQRTRLRCRSTSTTCSITITSFRRKQSKRSMRSTSSGRRLGRRFGRRRKRCGTPRSSSRRRQGSGTSLKSPRLRRWRRTRRIGCLRVNLSLRRRRIPRSRSTSLRGSTSSTSRFWCRCARGLRR